MSKRKYSTFLLCFLISGLSYSYGQTYNKIITDKEYYDFINHDIANDGYDITHHVFRKRIPLQPENYYYKDSADFYKKNEGPNPTGFIFHHHVQGKRVYSNHLDTLFTREDIDFFGQQLAAMKKTKRWKKPFLKSTLIDSAEYDYDGEGFRGRVLKFAVWGYSLPLFSTDRNTVIIIKSTSVSLSHFIYRKDPHGEWKLLREFNQWALDYF